MRERFPAEPDVGILTGTGFVDFHRRQGSRAAQKEGVSLYAQIQEQLRSSPRRWLVTGAAGFIGSHIVEELLQLNQTVRGLDNFVTGNARNLNEVRERVAGGQWARFTIKTADIAEAGVAENAMEGVDIVIHQAGFVSVPLSLERPLACHATNVTGTLQVFLSARASSVKRVVYASSSAVYGDDARAEKIESVLGAPLSFYGLSKLMDELYAQQCHAHFGLETIGLRYFNVFGSRQDPQGAYAAVIPRWTRAMLLGEAVLINGDGETSRDFCYVDNAVQANLLAATTENPGAVNQVYNVALDDRTSLNRLFEMLRDVLALTQPELGCLKPGYREFRPGDVRHSQADITKARRLLNYAPTHRLEEGIHVAMPWYVSHFSRSSPCGA